MDFLNKMISGTLMSDIVVLIVEPESTTTQESTSKQTAATLEHARIIRALGKKNLTIVVNKLEKVTIHAGLDPATFAVQLNIFKNK